LINFHFATDTNATDVGDLTLTRRGVPSVGQSSSISGYTSGGGYGNIIDKFPFATDTNATDVGNLTQARSYASGQSSSVSGYTSGGYHAPPGTSLNTIDKFPFAADSNATDVGDLTLAKFYLTGQSSTTNGYVSGGGNRTAGGPTTLVNTIEKFSFAVNNNASDVGDLSVIKQGVAGQSSTTHGYVSGGTPSCFKYY
jgi:hypothetical protein